VTPERREQLKLAKRRQRKKARDARLCIINPAHGPAGDGRVTCPTCSETRVERRRVVRAAPASSNCRRLATGS
jgi:hypothetical protein